jgi:hypothetical protein
MADPPPQLQDASLQKATTQSLSLAQLPGVGTTHCPLPELELPPELLFPEPGPPSGSSAVAR